MTTGPEDPNSPVGGPTEIGRTWWGAVAQCIEFKDGWLYQFSVPRYEVLSFWPRPALSEIIFRGQWTDTWNEEGINYVGVWVPRSTHEKILPEGPLPHQVFGPEDMDPETTRRAYRKWKAEQAESLSGPFLVLERVQEKDQKD